MNKVVNAVRSKLKMGAVLIPVALALAGCGKSWDGHYEALGFDPGEYVLDVKGDTAVRSIFKYGTLIATQSFKVEHKSDKVIFSEESGNNTYVYAQAADDRGLKCISESCDSMFSPLRKAWVRADKK